MIAYALKSGHYLDKAYPKHIKNLAVCVRTQIKSPIL